ncbi:MAG: hypothetical protein C0614_11840 [Desulfuromonas sp.]|nr:MAG: hypothetical protein C0614_11840 [Desulfuromonas sp.]
MNSLKLLSRGECHICHRLTLVRGKYVPRFQQTTQVCVRCMKVDSEDMVHESSKLVVAGD